MALVKSRAIVLRSHRLGETSKVVVCYTRDYGKVRLVAKGVRKGGGRLGAALEPFMVSGVVFYLRQERDLLFVSQAEVERELPELRRDVVRMAYAGVALELVDALVSEREPDPALFDLLEETLEQVATAPAPTLDVVLWGFELSLASALGYTPELSRCVVVRRPATRRAVASRPRRGGVVCGELRPRGARCEVDGRRRRGGRWRLCPRGPARGMSDRRSRRDRRNSEGFSGGARGTTAQSQVSRVPRADKKDRTLSSRIGART